MQIKEIQNNIASAAGEREAEYILEYVLQKDRNYIYLHPTEEIDDAAAAKINEITKRRALGEPLQYILHEAWFMGIAFYVDEGVLIPRQETETLVMTALEHIKRISAQTVHRRIRVLDICTGSGAIAVSLKKNVPEIQCFASDISEKALAAAQRNAKTNGCDIDFAISDLFDNINGVYDIITANPPYIPTSRIAGLSKDVRDHEPHLALDGGEDGLDLIRRIAADASKHLQDNGILLMEIGDDQGSDVCRIAAESGYECRIIKDINGCDRTAGLIKTRGEQNDR